MSFSQAIKKSALYEHQREGREQFFHRSMQLFQSYVHQFGAMTVMIQPFDLSIQGQSVFHDQSQENSLTYKLYQPGIRTLTFSQELAFEELYAFGSILTKSPKELAQQDAASYMWRADFKTISYIQIQSIEMAQESQADNEEIAAYIAYIQTQLSASDPLTGVNFRGFAAIDLQAADAIANAETQRIFGITRGHTPAEETEVLHKLLQREEQSLASRGMQLYTYLLRHMESPEALMEFTPHIFALTDELLRQSDYSSLGLLLDALNWQTSQPGFLLPHERKEFTKRLHNRLTSQQELSRLKDQLRDISRLHPDQRQSLRLYINLLGAKLYKELISLLDEVNTNARRFLFEILCTSNHASSLLPQLLRDLDHEEHLLYEFLDVATRVHAVFTSETLEDLMLHNSQRVQSRAFQLLLQAYPEEAPFLAESLLQQAQPEFRQFLLRTLCEAGNIGLLLAISYVQSEPGQKLSQDELETCYKIIGRSRGDSALRFFEELLQQKSQMLRPQIDRSKRLALEGLEAADHHAARQVLNHAMQRKDLHGKKLLRQMEESHARMQRRI